MRMILRIGAIAVILTFTSIAWLILGATISARTNDSNTRLTPGVGSTWGTPQEQRPPSATYDRVELTRIETQENGTTKVRMEPRTHAIPLRLGQSRISVKLGLDYRQK